MQPNEMKAINSCRDEVVISHGYMLTWDTNWHNQYTSDLISSNMLVMLLYRLTCVTRKLFSVARLSWRRRLGEVEEI